jgi:nucleotide-binding universal stress UspA family protein
METEGMDMTHGNGRIVVGVDGSSGGRAALSYALQDAARRDAAVEVVVAFATAETLAALCDPPYRSFVTSGEDVRTAIEKKAAGIVADVSGELAGSVEHLPSVTVTAVGGGAAVALLRAAHDADLLVVGSRGRGGFASMVLGSVSMQCVLHAGCPVTVVHPAPQAPPARRELQAERAGVGGGQASVTLTADPEVRSRWWIRKSPHARGAARGPAGSL